MKESPIKPFQKYSSEKKVYKVENSLDVNFGNQKGFHSSFEISIEEIGNEDETKNWNIDKIEDNFQILENPFMEILHKMEQNTYPLTINVDDTGVFLKAVNHQQNIENWKTKTEEWADKYDNSEKFISQYLVTMENEELFYINKYKEPFWNVLMFAPSYLNNGSTTKETAKWFIKGIGFIECLGIIRADKRDYGFDSHFISEFIIDEIFRKKINDKYLINTHQYRVELNIKLEYNSHNKHYSKKEAEFILYGNEIYKKEEVLYKEITKFL